MSDVTDAMPGPSQIWDLSFQIFPSLLLSRWVLFLAALPSLNDSGDWIWCYFVCFVMSCSRTIGAESRSFTDSNVLRC